MVHFKRIFSRNFHLKTFVIFIKIYFVTFLRRKALFYILIFFQLIKNHMPSQHKSP